MGLATASQTLREFKNQPAEELFPISFCRQRHGAQPCDCTALQKHTNAHQGRGDLQPNADCFEFAAADLTEH
jgi:hypothetical protein